MSDRKIAGKLFAKGLRNSEVAEQLGISVRAVEGLRRRWRAKNRNNPEALGDDYKSLIQPNAWTEREKIILLRMVSEGATPAQVGAILNRKPAAVDCKLRKMRARGQTDLFFGTPRPPKSAAQPIWDQAREDSVQAARRDADAFLDALRATEKQPSSLPMRKTRSVVLNPVTVGSYASSSASWEV